MDKYYKSLTTVKKLSYLKEQLVFHEEEKEVIDFINLLNLQNTNKASVLSMILKTGTFANIGNDVKNLIAKRESVGEAIDRVQLQFKDGTLADYDVVINKAIDNLKSDIQDELQKRLDLIQGGNN